MKQLKKYFLFIILTLVLIVFIVSCAQVGSISGGPKDTEPPFPVEMLPPNRSTHFVSKKVEIKFNEFIVLDKLRDQLLISPPVKETPDIYAKGKSLIIKFQEDLKPNTTYSIFFGDAICDLTENNPIHNFTYILSTGDYVDSLSMYGNIVNAFDLQPVEDAAVLLYANDNDTIPFDLLPLFVPPYYMTKTDVNGDFFITALAPDNYLVFALNDKNSNFIFDQPTEEIAFLDSLFYPFYIEPIINDTVNDSTEIAEVPGLNADTTFIPVQDTSIYISDSTTFVEDSTVNEENEHLPIQLYMFVQEDTVQKLLAAKAIRLNTIQFVFSLPAENVDFNIRNKTNDSLWFVKEWSKDKDTLLWFLKESNITVDTFDILLTYHADTIDSLYLPVKPKQKRIPNRRKKDEEPPVNTLEFTSNMKGNLKPSSKPFIKFYQPVSEINFDSALFVRDGDSIYSPEYYFTDSLNRNLFLPYTIEPDNSYLFYLPDSAVKDWNGYYNNAKMFNFKSKKIKEYGTLTINLNPKDSSGNYIVQFIDKKEKVLKQNCFISDTTVLYEYLDPGTYFLKIIFDKNGNGKWDTGNYFKKREPETVTYFQKQIDIRANWELEESWTFSEQEIKPPPVKVKKKK
jgi:hypothetical protein